MNDVNVGVQVPATTLNSTPTLNPTQIAQQKSQAAGKDSIIITPTGSERVLPTNSETEGLLVISILLVVAAIAILAFLYRDKLIKLSQGVFKKK